MKLLGSVKLMELSILPDFVPPDFNGSVKGKIKIREEGNLIGGGYESILSLDMLIYRGDIVYCFTEIFGRKEKAGGDRSIEKLQRCLGDIENTEGYITVTQYDQNEITNKLKRIKDRLDVLEPVILRSKIDFIGFIKDTAKKRESELLIRRICEMKK